MSHLSIVLTAGHTSGLHFGLMTLLQCMRLCGEGKPQVPAIRIQDYPGLRLRGFMMDVSRNKVPKLSTLKSIVDMLSYLKYNQLHLYFEHTFAYRHHQ